MSPQNKAIIAAILLLVIAQMGCSSLEALEPTRGSISAATLPPPNTQTQSEPSTSTSGQLLSTPPAYGPKPTVLPDTSSAPSTPYPTLVSEPYHLAYIRWGGSGVEMVFANPSSQGRRIIQLPEPNERNVPLIKGLSPDGRFYAHHTGDPYGERGNFTLHIMRLEDEMEITAIPLQTDDFADQMASLAERLAQAPPQSLLDAFWSDEPIPAERIVSEGISAFDNGIWSMAWSPDSTQLAFAAQIDGPTSDLYTYDVTTGALRRLSSGPQQIQAVKWSPDGQWIAHESAYYVGMQSPTTFNFASRDGSTVFSVDTRAHMRRGWNGSDIYVVTNAANGPGRFGLEAILMQTQRANMLWEDTYYGYVLDWEDGKLLIRTGEELIDEYGNPLGKDPGIYLVDFNQGSVELIYGLEEYSERFNVGMDLWDKPGEFALLNLDGDAYALDDEGKLRQLIESVTIRGWASPNGEVFMIRWQENQELAWYNVVTEDVRTFGEVELDCLAWRPDSQGFVYSIEERIYFDDMRRDKSVLIDDRFLDNSCEFTWVPGDQ
jgi:hypothetical protein